jgi:hypothetical protein
MRNPTRCAAAALGIVCLIASDASSSTQESRRSLSTTQAGFEDFTRLDLDALIDRLPRVGPQYLPSGELRDSHPASQELKRRLEAKQTLNEKQWQRALTRTGALCVRERWPADLPFAISMRAPVWLEDMSVWLTPRRSDFAKAYVTGKGFDSLACGTYRLGVASSAWYQRLGLLPPGPTRLEFEVVIDREDGSALFLQESEPGPTSPAWRGQFAFDVEVVADLEAAIPPVSTPELDAAVRRWLGLAFLDSPSWPGTYVTLDRRYQDDPVLSEIGLSLAIEVLHDGIAVQREPVLLSRESWSYSEATDRSFDGEPLSALSAELKGNAQNRAGWSIRVRGTSQNVLTLWEAKRRWSGEFVISLDELIARERELAPGGR